MSRFVVAIPGAYFVLVLVLLAGTAGLCQNTMQLSAPTTGSGAPSQPPATTVGENYLIAEEDVLRLDVWGETQLSNMQMQVTPDGKVNVPFLGMMPAAGLTQGELTSSIVKALADAGILYDAKVQITLLSMHQPTARVLGEVNRAGAIVFKDGDTIIDAIAQAGSYTDNAMLEKTQLTRRNSDKPIIIDLRKILIGGDLTHNYALQKGDSIFIPSEDYKNKVYVLGQVNRPGIVALREETRLLTAISMAGGQNDRASVKKTFVVRRDPNNPEKPQRIECNLNRLFDKADLSQDIVLQSGDVVVVPERNTRFSFESITRWISTLVDFTYLRRLGLF